MTVEKNTGQNFWAAARRAALSAAQKRRWERFRAERVAAGLPPTAADRHRLDKECRAQEREALAAEAAVRASLPATESPPELVDVFELETKLIEKEKEYRINLAEQFIESRMRFYRVEVDMPDDELEAMVRYLEKFRDARR